MIFTLYMKYIFTKQPYKDMHKIIFIVSLKLWKFFFFHLYVKGPATCNSQDADSHIARYQLANVIPLISAEVRESVNIHLSRSCMLCLVALLHSWIGITQVLIWIVSCCFTNVNLSWQQLIRCTVWIYNKDATLRSILV